MARQDLTEIICIIDKSGSMEAIRKDAIGGFNAFIREQTKLPGEACLTLVLFDDTYELVCTAKSLNEAEELTEATYVPDGSTALLDAVGRTIDEAGRRFAAMPEEERPGKILVAILTDGEENASKHYDRLKVFNMIRHQRERYSWEFAFLAANQDAFAEAESIGISRDMTSQFITTAEGTGTAFSTLSNLTSKFRAKKTK